MYSNNDNTAYLCPNHVRRFLGRACDALVVPDLERFTLVGTVRVESAGKISHDSGAGDVCRLVGWRGSGCES